MKSISTQKTTCLALRLLRAVALALLLTSVAHAQSPGTLDPTFAAGASANGAFNALALQANGQVLVAGSFTTFRGTSRNCIARLNTDGSLDSLNPGVAFSGYNGAAPTVQALAVQDDGKILAAGSFSVPAQSGGAGVVRFNADGSVDPTFNVGAGVVDDGGSVGTAYTLTVLTSGQILVGGAFVTFNGVDTAGLVRLNTDGSVDTTFNPGGTGIAANDYGQDVRSVVVAGGGAILIGGHFSAYDSQAAGSVARLNADGTPDATFDAGDGADDGGVYAVAVQSNGQALVGGGYNDFDGVDTNHLVRLNTDGSLDTSYDVTGGNLFVGEIDALTVQPDGSLLAGGVFLTQGGLVNSPHNGLARFLVDGTQDATFDSGNDSRQVVALALQNDGKAVAASNPYQLSGSATGDVFRYYDLVAAPTVTLTATAPTVTVGSGQVGEFTLSLSAAQSSDVVVNFIIKGTAVNGTDYVELSGAKKIKAGKTSKPIKVEPLGNLGGANKKTVKLALEPGTGYTVGTMGKVKVSILAGQ